MRKTRETRERERDAMAGKEHFEMAMKAFSNQDAPRASGKRISKIEHKPVKKAIVQRKMVQSAS